MDFLCSLSLARFFVEPQEALLPPFKRRLIEDRGKITTKLRLLPLALSQLRGCDREIGGSIGENGLGGDGELPRYFPIPCDA